MTKANKHSKSLLFLLFSSFILLAHSVLPHYHHDRVVCFINEQISGLCNVQENIADLTSVDSNQEIHSVHHFNISNFCDLQTQVLRQENSDKNTVLDVISLLSICYFLFSLNGLFIVKPIFDLFRKIKPYLINYAPPFVGGILSLRGPPSFYHDKI